jgi:nucleoside-diphosphate-sugar epimerase
MTPPLRTAILGGTGSIGLATAARLAQNGERVTILSRRRPDAPPAGVEWREVDVADPGSVRSALAGTHAERVVHLAALLQFACEEVPGEAVRVNIDGTLNVLTACRDLGIRRVVFGSSIAVYGERVDTMREEDPLPTGVSLYGMTKRVGEMLGERFRSASGLEFVALRYSGVFGSGEARSPGMARVRERIFECAHGRDVAIEGASGEERIHLTHVSDAAEATCQALTGPAPLRAVYNVAGPPGNHVSLAELHALVRELVPSAGRALWSGRARTAGPVDTARVAADLGWAPAVSLREGLRRMLSSSRGTAREVALIPPPGEMQPGR